MVGYMVSISLLPENNRNVILENFSFSKALFLSTKLPKRLFEKHKLLNC